MPRYTAAYSDFILRLREVETLVRFAATIERKDPVGHRSQINALCRGSIVLLSSHVEAFVRQLGEIALDALHLKGIERGDVASRVFYHISKDLFDEIEDTSDPKNKSEKILAWIQSDLSFWSQAGPFPRPIPIERFNRGFSNPSFKKISGYFNRFGYSEYKKDLASRLKAGYQPTINMVDHLVDTRNKIAHGDTGATKTPAEVLAMEELIRSFCGATDSAFAGWWQKRFCTIR